MPTVLITGSNRGLGLEFARQYARDGWRVVATCRNPDEADALRAVPGDVDIREMDVEKGGFADVEALARDLEGKAIDVLVNNAGVYGPRSVKVGAIDYAAWEQALRVNALAPVRVSECFLPHLERGRGKRIATITSKMGSIDDNTSGAQYIYRTAKAALNMAMKSLSLDLRPKGIMVAILHPGWVRTDMGGPGGLIDAEESVSGMRAVIDAMAPETSGRFLNYDGREIPW